MRTSDYATRTALLALPVVLVFLIGCGGPKGEKVESRLCEGAGLPCEPGKQCRILKYGYEGDPFPNAEASMVHAKQNGCTATQGNQVVLACCSN